ncbi:hypothetical protein Gorai_000488 [Gossypium raimondii]|uniref:Uncharacterized protein n=1 Tax=Gossypium raimondii TaxID=29730 RepID=A0A7J8PDZ8_GOSRA|nr:hypothetical protein [Gossypium raimondii]
MIYRVQPTFRFYIFPMPIFSQQPCKTLRLLLIVVTKITTLRLAIILLYH